MTSFRSLPIAILGALVALGLIVAPASANTVKTYYQSDSGATARVFIDTHIKVDLLAATGTPCHYKVTAGKTSKKFSIVSRSTHAEPHAPGTTGFPYHTVWTLNGDKAGTDTFKVALVCGAKNKVAKRFKLILNVKKLPNAI